MTRHATSVAVDGRGLLILGASGRGKSGLALDLMSRGARLVSDDQTLLTRDGADLWLSAPAPLRNLIEMRGLGLLGAESVDRARLCAVLDLDTEETERFPPHRRCDLLGLSFPLLHNSASPYFPAGLVQYLKGGRKE